ncbi:MAG: YbaK/EbsC family protein [Burkholderiales bacterium]|nr:YbaK/EbsC family protein [Burkholderiales bacterium]
MIARILANASVRRVQAALEAAGIAAEIIVTEEATPSSQAAAAKHGCDVAQIAKSVIFRALDSDRVVLVITSGANRVDEGRVVDAIGEPIGRADAAFVKARTGFSIGGVAPLGHLDPPIALFDETLLAFPLIYPAAGHPHTGFAVDPRALAAAAGARVLRVAP